MAARQHAGAPLLGLTRSEAEELQRREGYNELPSPDRRTLPRIVLEVLGEPMLALLLGGGLVYLALGDATEALILLVFAMLSILITIIQEARTERTLEALRDLTSPRALVVRDGERKRIAGREVVRGDLLLLGEGDRVPADAILIDCADLSVDESLLTGESVPVRKTPGGLPPPVRAAGCAACDENHVYSGTLVVCGAGLARVEAIGAGTEIGRIGQSLVTLEAEPPRLRIETLRLVRIAAIGGGAFSVVATLLYGFLRDGWLEAALGGIALGMAMLPEEFPVVLTVFMAMGAWRMSLARVLTRRASAIETFGSATVLCTDKTGTLTQNRMAIAEVRTAGGVHAVTTGQTWATLPQDARDLAEFGRLASAPVPFDPMEKAFHECGDRNTGNDNGTPPSNPDRTGWTLLKTYGLRPDLLAMTQVWDSGSDQGDLVVAAKGAPEAIASLCRLDAESLAALKRDVDAMAGRGLRVLGLARASWSKGPLPPDQTGFSFGYLGLVGLADPLRASVPKAVHDCRTAGIRVIMITGDYPVTAREIARQAGLADGGLLTGSQIAAMSPDEFRTSLRTTSVFARITPGQKLKIIEALKAEGEIVAMTGDGVNDAPSLKAAHIGIAMGGRGTDVAREASSIVLLDDDFGSIVRAIRLGRRIYDNLRKVMGFIISVHVPIAGMALLPLALGLPILFTPVHIAFLEMVIDPVCSLVFEAEKEEDDVMTRPPRSPKEPLVSLPLIGWSLAQGVVGFVPVLAMVLIGVERGMPDDEIRALAFVTLVLSVGSLIFIHRAFDSSWRRAIGWSNQTLRLVLLVVTAALAIVLMWPPASTLFRFGSLHVHDLLLAAVGVIAAFVALELLKPLRRPRLVRRNSSTLTGS